MTNDPVLDKAVRAIASQAIFQAAEALRDDRRPLPEGAQPLFDELAVGLHRLATIFLLGPPEQLEKAYAWIFGESDLC